MDATARKPPFPKKPGQIGRAWHFRGVATQFDTVQPPHSGGNHFMHPIHPRPAPDSKGMDAPIPRGPR